MFATDGVINRLLGMVGIETTFAWLGDTRTAIWVLILLAVWQFGSSMLIFLSALKQICEKKYDADLLEKGIRKEQIYHYGFAFEGKKVLIGTDREE